MNGVSTRLLSVAFWKNVTALKTHMTNLIFHILVPMHTFANYNANDILKTVDEAKVEEEESTPPTNSHIGVRVFLESISNFYKWLLCNILGASFGAQHL